MELSKLTHIRGGLASLVVLFSACGFIGPRTSPEMTAACEAELVPAGEWILFEDAPEIAIDLPATTDDCLLNQGRIRLADDRMTVVGRVCNTCNAPIELPLRKEDGSSSGNIGARVEGNGATFETCVAPRQGEPFVGPKPTNVEVAIEPGESISLVSQRLEAPPTPVGDILQGDSARFEILWPRVRSTPSFPSLYSYKDDCLSQLLDERPTAFHVQAHDFDLPQSDP